MAELSDIQSATGNPSMNRLMAALPENWRRLVLPSFCPFIHSILRRIAVSQTAIRGRFAKSPRAFRFSRFKQLGAGPYPAALIAEPFLIKARAADILRPWKNPCCLPGTCLHGFRTFAVDMRLGDFRDDRVVTDYRPYVRDPRG